MKKSRLFYIFCFSFLAIASFAQNNPNRLIAIPTPAHDFEIEVYFPGATPTKPNIKIEILEIYDGAGATYGHLVKKLQAKTQEVGADAVVIMKRGRYEDFDPEYEIYRTIHYLSGIAVKYIENINYLDQCKKAEKAYIYDKTKGIYKPSSKLHYSLMGDIDSTQGERTFHNYIKDHSTQHLILEKGKNWGSYLNSQGRQVRSYRNGMKKVYLKIMKNDLKIIHFKVRGEHDWATISIHRNEDKQEKERIITFEDRLERERYFYDDKKRLWKIEVSKKVNGQEEYPYFKIEYEFYTNEVLQQIMKKKQEPFFFNDMKR